MKLGLLLLATQWTSAVSLPNLHFQFYISWINFSKDFFLTVQISFKLSSELFFYSFGSLCLWLDSESAEEWSCHFVSEELWRTGRLIGVAGSLMSNLLSLFCLLVTFHFLQFLPTMSTGVKVDFSLWVKKVRRHFGE